MPPRSLDTTELTWPEVRDAIAQGYDTILVAAGSIEQHGPHLPEMTDTLIGTHLVRAIVERLPKALQGPTISIGCSEHHMAFAGTVTLRTETFIAVVRDVAHALAHHGFRTIAFIPSHGGNFAPLTEAMRGLNDDLNGAKAVAFGDLVGFVGVLSGVSAQFDISPEISGAHAGESETSLDLLLRPDYFHERNARTDGERHPRRRAPRHRRPWPCLPRHDGRFPRPMGAGATGITRERRLEPASR